MCPPLHLYHCSCVSNLGLEIHRVESRLTGDIVQVRIQSQNCEDVSELGTQQNFGVESISPLLLYNDPL